MNLWHQIQYFFTHPTGKKILCPDLRLQISTFLRTVGLLVPMRQWRFFQIWIHQYENILGICIYNLYINYNIYIYYIYILQYVYIYMYVNTIIPLYMYLYKYMYVFRYAKHGDLLFPYIYTSNPNNHRTSFLLNTVGTFPDSINS